MRTLKQMRRSVVLACLGFVLTALPAAALTPEDIQILAQRHGATAASVEEAVNMAGAGTADTAVLSALVSANPEIADVMVADYAALYPKQAAAAVAAAVKALPDQALAIIVAVVEMVPEMATGIVDAAIAALPDMGEQIKKTAKTAVDKAPVTDQRGEEYEPPEALPSPPDAVTIGGTLERPPVSTDKVASP